MYNKRVMGAREVEERFQTALAHCPFCRSGHIGLYMGYIPHVTCMACGADGPTIEGRRGEEIYNQHRAVLRWNTRA